MVILPSLIWVFLLSFLTLFVTISAELAASYSERDIVENVASEVSSFVPMSRNKRGEHDMLDFGVGSSTFPPDYEVEDDNKDEPETTEHTYYNMTIHTNDANTFDANYVDIATWMNESGATGQAKYVHLDVAYRKAAGVRLQFEFPFYGHRLQNLTIATGGFLYVGDQTHSWLAATQYIAPLMANFDTMDTQNRSGISYADDGKRIIVEWRDVTLRDNREAGHFTFQVHLWRNGNITFVYKDVPIPIGNISDLHHPCKLGISDAYLFNHKVNSPSPSSLPSNKRVIHEYHRITVKGEKIKSNTVVFMKALPTCLEATSCEECQKRQLKHFKCNWCNPKEGTKISFGDVGAEGNKPFCSDQMGLHRRRQDWIEGNCQSHEENQYCKAEDTTKEATVSTNESEEASTAVSFIFGPTESSSPSLSQRQPQQPSDAEGSGGLAFFTLLLLIAISAGIWVAYAYLNPHTRSGQLLIKYRPSKWQIPSSHVRYSASVHM